MNSKRMYYDTVAGGYFGGTNDLGQLIMQTIDDRENAGTPTYGKVLTENLFQELVDAMFAYTGCLDSIALS